MVTCLNLVLVRMNEKINNVKRRILAYLPAHLLTLIVKILKISVAKGRVVTTSNIMNA